MNTQIRLGEDKQKSSGRMTSVYLFAFPSWAQQSCLELLEEKYHIFEGKLEIEIRPEHPTKFEITSQSAEVAEGAFVINRNDLVETCYEHGYLYSSWKLSKVPHVVSFVLKWQSMMIFDRTPSHSRGDIISNTEPHGGNSKRFYSNSRVSIPRKIANTVTKFFATGRNSRKEETPKRRKNFGRRNPASPESVRSLAEESTLSDDSAIGCSPPSVGTDQRVISSPDGHQTPFRPKNLDCVSEGTDKLDRAKIDGKTTMLLTSKPEPSPGTPPHISEVIVSNDGATANNSIHFDSNLRASTAWKIGDVFGQLVGTGRNSQKNEAPKGRKHRRSNPQGSPGTVVGESAVFDDSAIGCSPPTIEDGERVTASSEQRQTPFRPKNRDHGPEGRENLSALKMDDLTRDPNTLKHSA